MYVCMYVCMFVCMCHRDTRRKHLRTRPDPSVPPRRWSALAGSIHRFVRKVSDNRSQWIIIICPSFLRLGMHPITKQTPKFSLVENQNFNQEFGIQYILHFSPPARWGLLDFVSDPRLLLLPFLLSFLPSSLPPFSCSSSSSSPDLICQPLIAVVVAGPHLPALDRSGPYRTPTPSARSL